ncbi:TPA: ribonuclease Y [Candidatus Dependentiae bacterium]|nr:MAG: Ribonuclease Y [candidate division TM6 bacterium GW2011_GWE2_31_21]KKP53591.1 MAG: Ribonuclease Y [candidate division TM6 bacterium GW2011_GWF2_33_332]HBS48169.1 ribonuclease Y [Candidatus Dependentiae bacterium]HBZ73593.1 ribonuclease Y [Candidatus Dependentiae bacterium]
MMWDLFVLLGIFCVGCFLGILFPIMWKKFKNAVVSSNQSGEKTLDEAKKKWFFASKEIPRAGFYDSKQEFLVQAEKLIDKLRNELQQKDIELTSRLENAKLKEIKLQKLENRLVSHLEKIGDITRKDAKKILLEILEDDCKIKNQKYIQKMEEEVRQISKQKSIDILATVMQRYLVEQVSIYSSSVVHLPNEEVKGKIIGKEGRNIRTLGMATGMEFVIGEIPDTVIISGFNPVRREIAKRALNLLIQDGRINPTRIEETVLECEKNINEEIEEFGRQAALEFGFPDLHPEIIKLLGKLYFRTSFTQNVFQHSCEVASFAKMLANELGLDARIASRCGLLHDIGKAISSEVEGSHASVGATLARQYGEDPVVVNAIASHHEEAPSNNVYGIIVLIADAISASRPGARRESLAAYIQRLDQLEKIALNFEGVKKSFAFQAGREIRVIVDETCVSDEESIILARDIARKIEETINFPGQIKVNVIRESRVIEYAR